MKRRACRVRRSCSVSVLSVSRPLKIDESDALPAFPPFSFTTPEQQTNFVMLPENHCVIRYYQPGMTGSRNLF
ncbi:hypothetical protein QE436_003795 [Pantoea anthophila]|nr:hypothetical protein [Pantoea anthophila]